jgi:16S rRNA A1518/A1519 N6-dimethyltransferase RsmA/KsgA/DIM1 with predicted DNA glycosylase/AP lyase activity
MFQTAQQFFPTPTRVASKVWVKLNELNTTIGKVLDPSGGKGDLLDYGNKTERRHYGCRDGIEGYAIEIDTELQAILREKGYTVLGGDFLEWDEPIEFNSIVMNPPFNNGVHHVLKAWNILADGGALVALLNLETVNNLCSSERQRLSLIVQQYGGWEDLGQCFKEADRTTDVEVAMVWLKKPKRTADPAEFRFTGDFRRASDETYEAFAASPLAAVDAVDNLVAQYRACLSVLKARHQAQTELRFHLGSIPGVAKKDDDLGEVGDFFKEVECLKYRFWWSVFKMSRMSEITTTYFKKKFDEFVGTQVNMAFDKQNILEALAMFFQNREQIMIDSLVTVFDRATKYHESNITHREGWKSNSGWKVNSKIVLPHGVYWCKSMDWWEAMHKGAEAFLDDLDEVLCWIADVDHRQHQSTSRMISYSKIPPNTWIERPYYEFKLFKKGTIHIRFKDQYLLDDFNAIAAKGKQWLGGEGF